MRKLLVLAVLVAASGCASGNVRLFQKDPAPPGVRGETVQSLICAGEVQQARDYVQLRGGGVADQVEQIEAARKWAKDHVSECPCFDGGCKPARPAGGVQ